MNEHESLAVTLEMSGGTAVVVAAGELDSTSSHLLSTVISRAWLSAHRKIVIDLDQICFIDRPSTDMLVAALVESYQRGRSLTLRNPSRRVLEVMRLLKVDTLFPLEPRR